jgi:hypothetical protein
VLRATLVGISIPARSRQCSSSKSAGHASIINMELTASKSAELVDGTANWQPIILSAHTG